MHPTSTNGVEDMAALCDLHDGSIMYNLYRRYQENKIYVSVILLSAMGMSSLAVVYSGGRQ